MEKFDPGSGINIPAAVNIQISKYKWQVLMLHQKKILVDWRGI